MNTATKRRRELSTEAVSRSVGARLARGSKGASQFAHFPVRATTKLCEDADAAFNQSAWGLHVPLRPLTLLHSSQFAHRSSIETESMELHSPHLQGSWLLHLDAENGSSKSASSARGSGPAQRHGRELAPLETCAHQAACCIESPNANTLLDLESLKWGLGQELGGGGGRPLCKGIVSGAGRSMLGAIGGLSVPRDFSL